MSLEIPEPEKPPELAVVVVEAGEASHEVAPPVVESGDPRSEGGQETAHFLATLLSKGIAVPGDVAKALVRMATAGAEGGARPDEAPQVPQAAEPAKMPTVPLTPQPGEMQRQAPIAIPETVPPPESMDGLKLSPITGGLIADSTVVEGVHPQELAANLAADLSPAAESVPEETKVSGTGDISDEATLAESAGSDASEGEMDGAGQIIPYKSRSSITTTPPVADRAKYGNEVQPLTDERRGAPDRLTLKLNHTVYAEDPAATETEGGLPPQSGAMAVASRVFGDRGMSIIESGGRGPDEKIRVSVLGAGTGVETGILLSELAKSHPEVYARAAVELSDVHAKPLQAAMRSPELLRHQAAGVELTYALRNAQVPNYDPAAKPDLILVQALNDFPNRVIKIDDSVEAGRVAHEARWVDGVVGSEPMVLVDPATGTVSAHPVSALGNEAYLGDLSNPRARAALLPKLMGRLTSGEGVPDAPYPPLVRELTPQVLAREWDEDEVAALKAFLGGPEDTEQTHQAEPGRYYSLMPGVSSFIGEVFSSPDSNTLVVALAQSRTVPNGDISGQQPPRNRGLGTLRGIHSYTGALTTAVLEQWQVIKQCRALGARAYHSGGAQGELRIIVMDKGTWPQVLRAERTFVESVGQFGAEVFRERERIREMAAQCLKQAISMRRSGNEYLSYVQQTLDALYTSITHPSVRTDHVLMLEIAELCNDTAQGSEMPDLYGLGNRFAQRALDLASHTSVDSYRAAANAQLGLGHTDEAIGLLRTATGVSTRNAAVWDELRNIYRSEGRWGEFVGATVQYINTARDLGSREVTMLLADLCEAQEKYAAAERNTTDPHAAPGTRIEVTVLPVPGVDYEYHYATNINRAAAAPPVNRQTREQAYEMCLSAVQVAEQLARIRSVDPNDPQEQPAQQAIMRLRQALVRARADLPQPDEDIYARRAVWFPAANGGRGGDEADVPINQYFPGYEPSASPSPEPQKAVRAEADPTEVNRVFRDNLLTEIGLPLDASEEEIIATVRTFWELSDEFSQRMLAAELVLGRSLKPLQGVVGNKLESMLDNGGSYDDLLEELKLLKAELERRGI
jgi:tetratricopeptide (TPR) repeat protein